MQSPIRIELQRSRGLMASVLLAHCATGLALFLASAQVWVLSAGFVLNVLSLGLAWHAEVLKDRLILCLMADGGVILIRGDEAPLIVSAGKAAVAFRHVVWLSLDVPRTEIGRVRRLRLMLLPFHLRCGQWRSLQLWLRHRLPAATSAIA